MEPSAAGSYQGQWEGKSTSAPEGRGCLQTWMPREEQGRSSLEQGSLGLWPVACLGHSCPETACLWGGVQLQIVGDHEQLQGKDSKLQMQDKILMISVEVFLLCCCTVLIKPCIFRHSD